MMSAGVYEKDEDEDTRQQGLRPLHITYSKRRWDKMLTGES